MHPHDEPLSDPLDALPVDSLRRLARGLVFERGSADDLVQEAWLAALQARGEIRGLAGWLAGTMRHLARNRAREEQRRDRRERLAARAEALPGADEVSARIELLHRLLEAVDRLEAPYREAIALRYFDDLPPRAIARRLGIPVNTARSRVRRGLERLRAELDPGPGREREALLAALVPLFAPELGSASRAAHPSPRKTLAMQHPLVLAGSALLLGTLTWFLVRRGDAEPVLGSASVAVAPESSAPAQAVPPRASAPPSPGGHASAPSGRAQSSAWTVRGRVRFGEDPYPSARLVGRVFAGGRPVGAPLSEEHFQAGAEGDFAWAPATQEDLFNLEVRAERAEDLGRPVRAWFVAGDPPPEDWVLAVNPSDATLRGTVRGPDGAPLADAWVALALGDEEHGVRSAADGGFTLGCVSRFAPAVVCAWREGLAPGYAELVEPLLGSEHAYEITLEHELRLHGTVRGADGTPLAGAQVTVDFQGMPASSTVEQEGDLEIQTSSGPMLVGTWPHSLTDEAGRYELAGIHPRATTVVLRASASDHRPARIACQNPATTAEHAWDLSLARAVTVTGRVRAAGESCEGAWITVGSQSARNEGVAETWSDAEGRFTLANVAAGAQHLRVWRRGLAQLRADLDVRSDMPALELELGPGHFAAGVVLGPQGAPVRAYAWIEDRDRNWPLEVPGLASLTGPDGRFRLTDLPAGPIVLSVNADGCEPLSQEVALDRDDLVLRLVADPQASEPPPTPVVPVTAASGAASLGGRLLDLGGNARAGEQIELVASAATLAAGPWQATTGAHGEFRFADLPAGTFDARWVRREGELTVLDLERRVTLAADEARELELRPEGEATLRGTIEFLTQPPAGSSSAGFGTPPVFGPPPGGMPALAVVRVYRFVNGMPSPTGGRGGFAHDGRFELEGLGAGAWYVEAKLVIPDSDPAGSGEGWQSVSGNGEFETGTDVTLPARGAVEVRLGVLYAQ